MTRARGELPPEEERLLGIVRPSLEEEEDAARIQAEKAELKRVALSNLMHQSWFREWLWETLTRLETFGHPVAASPTGFPDPLATQFYMGRKSAGWELWTFFDDLAPDQASLMRREASRPQS